MMTRNLLAGAMLLGISGITFASHREVSGSPAPACRLQGVWDLESNLLNGKAQPVSGFQQRKIMTRKHFMWLSQATRRDTLPLKTALDSARYYSSPGGSGTYTVTGRNVTEHIDYFVDPSFLGRDFHATCRTEGNRWYHTYYSDFYTDSATRRSRRDTTTEVFRRVE